MATASSSSSPPQESPQATDNSSDDSVTLEVNRELERMVEDVENMSVRFTWMAYDMVALRTNPELVASMQKLLTASQRCKATVLGAQRPETNE